jgi:hypothetical protein
MLVRDHDAEQKLLERDADERRGRGVTFRELAVEYLEWLEHVKAAKPSTVRDHRLLLAEPGQTYRCGAGSSRGQVMAALGDRPAREVTRREVEDLLRSVSSTGVAPRTVNKVRQLVCAILNYGTRPSTYALPTNPVVYADRRREPERGPLALYSSEQVEALARSLAARRSPRSLSACVQPGGDRGPCPRGRPGRGARQSRRLRRPPAWGARGAALAGCGVRRPEDHCPPGALWRHRAVVDQEPPVRPGLDASASSSLGDRAELLPDRVQRALGHSLPRGC